MFSIISISIIIIFSIFMIFFAYKDFLTYKNGSHQDYKSLIVSIGVLGTFIGIFIGLIDFNTENIKDSVPILLEGLKTAFLTSIIGMFLSIFLSSIQKDENESEVYKREVLILASIEKNLLNNHKEMLNFLENKLNESNKFLEKAIDALSEGATKEITNALKEVIKDFNQNLTTQFGDNFKELNISVKNMIIWQNHYKDYILSSEKTLNSAIENIKSIDINLLKITKNYERINLSHIKLENIIKINENQINNLEIHMKELQLLGNDARLMITSVNMFSDKIKSSLSNQSETLSKMLKDSNIIKREIERQLPESLGRLNEALSSLTDKFRDDYNSFLEHMSIIIKSKKD